MSVDHETRSPYAPPAVPVPPPLHQMPVSNPDAAGSQLRVLGVLHHVLGGLSLASALAFGLILAFGISQEAAEGFSDPSGIGAIGMFSVIVATSLLGGALCIWAGLNLMRHTRPGLCTAVAALCCLNVPLGTALGITTLVILQRHEVRALFAGTRRP